MKKSVAIILLGLVLTSVCGCSEDSQISVGNAALTGGVDGDGNAVDLRPEPGPKGFCDKSVDGSALLVKVWNRRNETADPSKTQVSFSVGGSIEAFVQDTPSIPGGDTSDVLVFNFPAGCFSPDCNFTITVDSADDVHEGDGGPNAELNNTEEGVCLGPVRPWPDLVYPEVHLKLAPVLPPDDSCSQDTKPEHLGCRTMCKPCKFFLCRDGEWIGEDLVWEDEICNPTRLESAPPLSACPRGAEGFCPAECSFCF